MRRFGFAAASHGLSSRRTRGSIATTLDSRLRGNDKNGVAPSAAEAFKWT